MLESSLLIQKRVPFAVPSKWIESIFLEAESIPIGATAGTHRGCFRAVSIILRHGALMSPLGLEDLGAYLHSQSFAFERLSSLCGSRWLSSLPIGARIVEAPYSSLRDRGVRLRSQSALTRSFEAPAAEVMRLELKKLQRELSKPTRNPAARAFVLYFVLLTLHPLPDGNGRLARGYFAALLWSFGFFNPIYIIALARCFEGRGDAFQIAAHRARSGDHLAVLNHFKHAVDRSASHAEEIMDLCEMLDNNNLEGAHRILDSLRAFLYQISDQ